MVNFLVKTRWHEKWSGQQSEFELGLRLTLGLSKSDWLIFFELFEINQSDCLIQD
jgi:hypothetical protein